MNRSKTALKALVAAAALAVPVGLTIPAQATTSNGCTVTPSTPFANGDIDAGGVKQVDYKASVSCTGAYTIYVTQQRWEQDTPGGDDLIGTSTLTHTFPAGGGALTWTVTGDLPDWDGALDNYAEVYQATKFKVRNGAVTSSYTAYQNSAVRSIHQ